MNQPESTPAIDELIAKFYRAFDNREACAPTLDGVAQLFIEKAIVVHSQDFGTEVYSVYEFAKPRIELLTSGNLVEFHEWEIKSTTNVYGDLATRISEYQKLGLFNGNSYTGMGTKLFQLAKITGAWRITCLSWYDRNT